MKYIRYLIYLAFYALLVLGGFWLYGLFGAPGLHPTIGRLSRPIITMAVLALLPFFKAINRRKLPALPKIEGLSSNALVLECRYRCRIALPPAELREAIKEICESLLFPGRYLSLSYEDERLIEYSTAAREESVGGKRPRRNNASESTITIEIEGDAELSDLSLLSKSDNLFTTLDNDANEEHVLAIVAALSERGLVRK